MSIIDENKEVINEKPKRSKAVEQTAYRADGTFDEVLSSRILLKAYKEEDKKDVRISPMYAPYFGNIMRVSINGIAVAIPCNGTQVSVPATHAAEVTRRIAAVDKQLSLQKGLASGAIIERRPGDIPIV